MLSFRTLPHRLARAFARWISRFSPEPGPEPLPVPVPVPERRPRPYGRFVLAAAALTLGMYAPGASAADWSRSWDRVDGSLVDVQVVVDGQTAPLYLASGRWERRYFQAFKGRNYSLVVRNNTGRRVGVLIAVDGLNVVNGELSSLSNHEPMYVLGPYERAEIRGWRTSLQQVRRFVFVDEQRSYAERTGQGNGDLGWIRVLSFNEVRPIAWRDGDWNRSRTDAREEAAPAPGELKRGAEQPNEQEGLGDRRAAPESQKLQGAPESSPGTGWGERRWDPVQRTEFQAARSASDRITLRYEYASGLRALGIFPRSDRNRVWERERGQYGFAQPPTR
ncbi:MAG: hypothetical protein A2W00_04345 [Candidatus Eisenbacteria bacterium RBG_16_71_46]|nr:MAG: hypothetical protein A2W00_04345 [Candidatus Eisenbacteria bacterium RBG_16_71_46]